jgi:hypothetical protein
MSAFALTSASFPGGIELPSGIVLEPGTEIFLVHKTPSYFPSSISGKILTTVNAAFAQRNANVPGAIVVLSGHTESVSSADYWSSIVANTKVIGLGTGSGRPTFTWTIATSTVLVDKADVGIYNCNLAFEPGAGTVNVAAPITVSEVGCEIVGNYITTGTDANNKVTIAITTTAAGDRLLFRGNTVRGAAAATMTTFLRLVGSDNTVIEDNDIVCGTTAAAVGPIQALTTASTGVRIAGNLIQNNATSSTACITGMAGLDGWISRNFLRNMTDASVAHIVTPGNAQLFENYGVNNNGERGIALGTASV